MPVIDTGFDYLLRQPSEGRGGIGFKPKLDDRPDEKTDIDDDYIFCRQCRHVITSPSERIQVQGAHRHTFANPQGIVFEIGCFGNAQGCGYAGSATDEFSWFKGYRWRIAVCGKCLIHLGWLYISNTLPGFNGLILDRLIGR